MPYAQINGIRLHYEVEGHGPPLLFVAGLGQPAIAWDPELIQDTRAILSDNHL